MFQINYIKLIIISTNDDLSDQQIPPVTKFYFSVP